MIIVCFFNDKYLYYENELQKVCFILLLNLHKLHSIKSDKSLIQVMQLSLVVIYCYP